MRFLIGLLSCQTEGHRDQLCAETWLPAAKQIGMDVVFLVGYGRMMREPSRSGDYLRLPAADNYPALPQKTAGFVQWALQRDDWEFLFKADNDTFLVPWRLQALNLDGVDYTGCEPGPSYRGWASGGGGYVLSRLAAEIVAKRLSHGTGAEDKLVGRLLKKAGIVPKWDERFVPWGSEERRPRLDNDLITAHKIDDEMWRRTWDEIVTERPPA